MIFTQTHVVACLCVFVTCVCEYLQMLHLCKYDSRGTHTFEGRRKAIVVIAHITGITQNHTLVPAPVLAHLAHSIRTHKPAKCLAYTHAHTDHHVSMSVYYRFP